MTEENYYDKENKDKENYWYVKYRKERAQRNLCITLFAPILVLFIGSNIYLLNLNADLITKQKPVTCSACDVYLAKTILVEMRESAGYAIRTEELQARLDKIPKIAQDQAARELQ